MQNTTFIKLLVWMCSTLVGCGKYSHTGFKSSDSSFLVPYEGTVRVAHSAKDIDAFVTTSDFTARKTPNIYVVFFDTLRPDYALEQHGAMASFFDTNFSPKYSHAAGTSTIYSMFSFFHGMPGFLTYDFLTRTVDNNYEYGSIFLKIIKKLGYKISIFGDGWDRDPAYVDPDTLQSYSDWSKFITTVFGWENYITAYPKAYNSKLPSENSDVHTLNVIKRDLPSMVDSPEKHFTFLAFYNSHCVYKWLPGLPGISKEQDVISRYNNSVITSDMIFKEVLELLRTLPGYDEAIIILLSDHGERFLTVHPDSPGRTPGHGGMPDSEVTPNLLSIQFTSSSLYNEHSQYAFASTGDILPTIFDYIGIVPTLSKKLSFGHSLLSYSRNSVLVNASNYWKFPNKMTLISKKYKAWITLPSQDIQNIAGGSLSVDKFTDLNDMPIENLCANKDRYICSELLNTEFSDALSELGILF